MGKSVLDVIQDVLTRLGDLDESVWTKDELHRYLQEGYRILAVKSECFWDTTYLEDQPYTGNYTKDAEKELALQTGMSGANFFNKFCYTKEADADFAPAGQVHLGPANHTKRSEYDNNHVSKAYFLAVHDLPDSLLEIERATWNQIRIGPLRSVELERGDSQFQTQSGEVQGYVQDKDGIKRFRKWRIPSQAADTYTITGKWGLLRDPANISGETVNGSWGIARRVPGLHPCSGDGSRGFPRRPQKVAHNTKIEFTRKGQPINRQTDEFELPAVYVKYLRHFTMFRALERNGPGQDSKMAAWWKGLFDAGIARMKRRKQAVLSRKRYVLGGDVGMRGRPPTARLPWNYGYSVR